MTREKRENPAAIRSKNALAQSLLALLMKQSIDNISISEITSKAGLSRQTFYTNFSKKEDILDYILAGLFRKYKARMETVRSAPGNFIIDYFIFWDKNKEFLDLLFSRNMGHLFCDYNRVFFTEDLPDEIFASEQWQIPYIKASLAGLTNELLRLWIMNDQGLSVNVLSAIAKNLLTGSIFR